MAEPAKISKRSRNVGGVKRTTESAKVEQPMVQSESTGSAVKLPRINLPSIPVITLPSNVFPIFQGNSTPKITATTPKTQSSGSSINIPEFRASSYLANDLFNVSSSVEPQSEADRETAKQTIAGQKRRIETVIDNLALNRLVIRAEGEYVGNLIEATKVDIKRQDLATEGVKLQAAVTKTGIEQAKLTGLQHDLKGETRTAELKAESWNLKIEGLEADVNHARQLLDAKKADLSAKIKGLLGN